MDCWVKAHSVHEKCQIKITGIPPPFGAARCGNEREKEKILNPELPLL
jgi:hypothetical protein